VETNSDTRRRYDFFISRAGADNGHASWIYSTVVEAGYTALLQDVDFGIGENFVAHMHRALQTCDRLIAVLSPDYFQSQYCQDEWQVFYLRDRREGGRRLIPVRVRPVRPPGLMSALAYLDVAGLPQADAERHLLKCLKGLDGDTPLPDTLEPVGAITNRSMQSRLVVGRDVEMALLRAAFQQAETGAVSIVAVCGAAGVGKTTLAEVHLQHSHGGGDGTPYRVAWWIAAASEETIMTSLAELGDRLGAGKEAAGANTAQMARIALDAINDSKARALLIFDNVDTFESVSRWLPRRNADIVLTSRYTDWPSDVRTVELANLSKEDATDLLHRLSRRAMDDTLRALADSLGGLPLALSQAGAHLRINSTLPIQKYAANLERLMAIAPPQEPASVFATLISAVEALEARAPDAAVALRQIVSFAPDRVPLDLISAALQDGPSEDLRDELGVHLALQAAALYSLVALSVETEGLKISIHRLLRAALRRSLRPEHRIEFDETAARAALRGVRHELTSRPADIWPHADALGDHPSDAGREINRAFVEFLSSSWFENFFTHRSTVWRAPDRRERMARMLGDSSHEYLLYLMRYCDHLASVDSFEAVPPIQLSAFECWARFTPELKARNLDLGEQLATSGRGRHPVQSARVFDELSEMLEAGHWAPPPNSEMEARRRLNHRCLAYWPYMAVPELFDQVDENERLVDEEQRERTVSVHGTVKLYMWAPPFREMFSNFCSMDGARPASQSAPLFDEHLAYLTSAVRYSSLLATPSLTAPILEFPVRLCTCPLRAAQLIVQQYRARGLDQSNGAQVAIGALRRLHAARQEIDACEALVDEGYPSQVFRPWYGHATVEDAVCLFASSELSPLDRALAGLTALHLSGSHEGPVEVVHELKRFIGMNPYGASSPVAAAFAWNEARKNRGIGAVDLAYHHYVSVISAAQEQRWNSGVSELSAEISNIANEAEDPERWIRLVSEISTEP